MRPNKQALLVTQQDLPHGIIYKNRQLLADANFWHKFIIMDRGNYSREDVLRAILDHVHPLDLIPVSYVEEGSGCSFLARNCQSAIQLLCKDNLIVSSFRDFQLEIILAYTSTKEFTVDVQKNILFVLSKRYDKNSRILDLNRFHADPDLDEFSPLSQPKIMYYVLHLAKCLVPIPTTYIIQDNSIRSLSSMNALNFSISSITTFDFRNNLLKDYIDLSTLKIFKLKHLFLDGNPLCELFNAETYKTKILDLVPTLETLDGISLASTSKISHNFLCNHNGVDLVNQFLEHYYTIYDSKNRTPLEFLYHRSALFSMNCHFHNNQISSNSTRVYNYNNISRNIKKIANISYNDVYLFESPKKIVNILSELPLTEHDQFSFAVDLIHYTNYSAVICITGVFRELPVKLLDVERVYGFRRTFVLQINNVGECLIVNDMTHVYNALNSQLASAFKINKPAQMNVLGYPKNGKEQQELVDAMIKITRMNIDWTKKCLEECEYGLEKALRLFIDLYQHDKIPKEAFESNF